MSGHYRDAGSIPLYRIKGSEVTSPFVGDLALEIGKVSIDKKSLWQIKRYGRLIGSGSVFNEIEWINPFPDIKRTVPHIPFSANHFSTDFWAEQMICFLMDWFRKTLVPEREYWILHSSGGDSRILSGVLAKLRTEEDFRPRIRFVSWYPEAIQSRKILEFLGWREEHIWSVGEDDPQYLRKEQYWNRDNFYDFETAGYLTNGEIQPFGSLQSRFWRPYYSDVSHVSVIMAMIGDMVMGAHWWLRWAKRFLWDKGFPVYTWRMKWNIIIATSARYNGLGLLGYPYYFRELLTPTMETEFVSMGLQIPLICRWDDDVRKLIQEKLAPGLSGFRNESGGWTMQTSGIIQKAYADYLNSEFYRKYQLNVFYPDREDEAVPYLSLAGLHDLLSRQGVKISD